jgi:hypothetical protein
MAYPWRDAITSSSDGPHILQTVLDLGIFSAVLFAVLWAKDISRVALGVAPRAPTDPYVPD